METPFFDSGFEKGEKFYVQMLCNVNGLSDL